MSRFLFSPRLCAANQLKTPQKAILRYVMKVFERRDNKNDAL